MQVNQLEIDKLKENAVKAADILGVMSNASRLLALCYLCEGDKTVQELQAHLGIKQSALSQHLAVLRREKLVTTSKEGKSVIYSLASADVRTLLQTLCEIYCR